MRVRSLPCGRDQRHRRDYLMTASGKQLQTGSHLLIVAGLGQDAPANRHNRIGRQDKGRFSGPFALHPARLFDGQAQRMDTRLLAFQDALVYARRAKWRRV